MVNVHRIHNIWLPRTENQEFMKERQCDPEQCEGRLIFISMFNDVIWREEENVEKCKSNSHTVANYARRFPLGH